MLEHLLNINFTLGILPLLPLIGWGAAVLGLTSGAVAINNMTDDPTTVNNHYYGLEEPVELDMPWWRKLLPDIPSLKKYLFAIILGVIGWQWWKNRKPDKK